ncbi:cysteine dioxygenase [Hymenobacter jeollabukensis]|uniref:Cysteine dioxygenase n=1 Tax=Hymenobacter jeollabukensis TaxID=2025313 RepID=A0A5R8WU65_9BACT|nr:cysteine dioxygenase family protein [Hymenobacter jeollabukensis]TLM95318.1 hypothetical protein FDY95_05895 [Hymenobacter jeollabukensis]
MSHHEQLFLNAPSSRLIAPPPQAARPMLRNAPADKPGTERLIVVGQGVLAVHLTQQTAFSLTLQDPTHRHGFRLDVTEKYARFARLQDGHWLPYEPDATHEPGLTVYYKEGSGLDKSEQCPYWLSLDSNNGLLRYGKGEVRRNTLLAELRFPIQPPVPEKQADDPYAWVRTVATVAFDPAVVQPFKMYRDPVIVDPAMVVVDRNRLTMDDIARNRATVAANLTATCQLLYDNVSGEQFTLNTPDFPDFAQAIEASIASPDGWCYRTLQEKAGEFGGSNPDETYLRITLGLNQGDSPGIPYVMEIWPPGHYSPLHNHGGANAVIRVLHGEITVSLFPMLSRYHQQPFMIAKFGTGDVTWISPELNQNHQLHNTNVTGPTCITIQCYLYGEGDTTHYKYFDYLNEHGQIKQFTPNSDMSFLEFKALMKREWLSRYRPA